MSFLYHISKVYLPKPKARTYERVNLDLLGRAQTPIEFYTVQCTNHAIMLIFDNMWI